MVWKQVSIETNEEGIDLISSIFIDAGANGVEIDGGSSLDVKADEYISTSFIAQKTTYVKAYFGERDFANTFAYIKGRVESLKNESETDLGSLHVHLGDVQDTDWNANFRKHFTAFRAAGNIVIKPTWESYQRKEDDIVIEMDPGQVFGSGTHETTKMCLELVQKHMKQGAAVLDVGCGSGILGIASAKLGAGRVLALDNDSVGVDVALSNARANDVTNFDARKSDLLQNADGYRFDIILANIIADVILRLNTNVSNVMAPDAVYIISGIIEDRLDDVTQSLKQHGFDIIETLSQSDWRAVAARRQNA